MNEVNLDFTGSYTPPNSNEVNFEFSPKVDEEHEPRALSIVIKKPAPWIRFDLRYSSNVSRPVTSSIKLAWEPADKNRHGLLGGWGLTDKLKTCKAIPWAVAGRLFYGSASPIDYLKKTSQNRAIPWEIAQCLVLRAINSEFIHLKTNRLNNALPWEEGRRIQAYASPGFVQLAPRKKESSIPCGEAASILKIINLIYGKGAVINRAWFIPWEQAIKPPNGRSSQDIKPPEPPIYKPNYDLNFECKFVNPDPLHVWLNFGKHHCNDAGIPTIEDKKVYFIVNEFMLTRVSDGVEIELEECSIGIDRQSWCWSFSGTIAYYDLEKVEPGAFGLVEVELTINGNKWRFVIEYFDEDESFGKTSIPISGRSLTSHLDAPRAPTRSFIQSGAIYSRALAEAELTRAGLVTGFDLDWRMIDPLGWAMPAGSWSYEDLPPIQVINAIAQGAGGYVNSHMLEKKLIVQSDYPVPPWEWGSVTPDLSIAASIIKRQRLQWNEKPLYTGVYVSGEHTGVSRFVKRNGTSGDFQPAMYVSPFIGDVAAARNKGMCILSDTGQQSEMTLALPMHADLGVPMPGTLISVGMKEGGTWRGLIRGIGIQAGFSGDAPTVTQTLKVERHY